MRLPFKLIAFLVLLVMSCEEKDDLIRKFVIKEGEHYSTPRIIETLQSNELVFQARFNESAMYIHEESGFQDSKNKLLGFSDCNSLHHENSARFAWQWFNDRLEIFAYCYVDGQRVEEFVGVATLNSFHRYSIKMTKDGYLFRLDDKLPVVIPRGSVCSSGVYYKLWPYFGGSVPAPHLITIDVKPAN